MQHHHSSASVYQCNRYIVTLTNMDPHYGPSRTPYVTRSALNDLTEREIVILILVRHPSVYSQPNLCVRTWSTVSKAADRSTRLMTMVNHNECSRQLVVSLDMNGALATVDKQTADWNVTIVCVAADRIRNKNNLLDYFLNNSMVFLYRLFCSLHIRF